MPAGHTEGLKASDAHVPGAGGRGTGPGSFSGAPAGGKQVSVPGPGPPEAVLFSLSVREPEGGRGREGAVRGQGTRQLPSRSRRIKDGPAGPGRPRQGRRDLPAARHRRQRAAGTGSGLMGARAAAGGESPALVAGGQGRGAARRRRRSGGGWTPQL